MTTAASQTAPEALLLIATGCAHCPVTLDALTQLLKEGAIGYLEVINIAVAPERAVELGVRSVPWAKIGEFELEGAMQVAELREWVARARDPQGMAQYIDHLLGSGQLAKAESLLRRKPRHLQVLGQLLADPDTGLNVRVGICALMESLHDSADTTQLIEPLGKLAQHADARIRADACHCLSMIDDPQARALLEAAREDPSPEVREIVEEALAGPAH